MHAGRLRPDLLAAGDAHQERVKRRRDRAVRGGGPVPPAQEVAQLRAEAKAKAAAKAMAQQANEPPPPPPAEEAAAAASSNADAASSEQIDLTDGD